MAKNYHCRECHRSTPHVHAEPGVIRCVRCSSALLLVKPPCGASEVVALETKEDDR